MCKKCEQRNEKLELLKSAALPLGHVPQYKSNGPIVDMVVCSCGWESPPFYDGVEYAWDKWIEHAESVIPEAEEKDCQQ